MKSFTSESVMLAIDPHSRVAVESLITTGASCGVNVAIGSQSPDIAQGVASGPDVRLRVR